MRLHKGKWVASYKDTFSTCTLDAIILAHLTELYKHKDKDGFGVSMVYVSQQAGVQGIGKEGYTSYHISELDFEDTYQQDMDNVTDNEPKMEDYKFHIEMISGERDPVRNTTPCTFEVTGQEEYDRHRTDEDAYWKRKEAGQKLFGNVYSTLCW